MMQKLLLNKGIVLSLPTVRKYMNVELKLKSVTRKPKHHYHKGSEAYAVSNNLLQQDFSQRRKMKNGALILHTFILVTGIKDTIVLLLTSMTEESWLV